MKQVRHSNVTYFPRCINFIHRKVTPLELRVIIGEHVADRLCPSLYVNWLEQNTCEVSSSERTIMIYNKDVFSHKLPTCGVVEWVIRVFRGSFIAFFLGTGLPLLGTGL